MRSKRLFWLVLLLVCLIVTGWWWTRPPHAADIPQVDLSEAYPRVSAGITAARESVRQNPHSATAWGDLGMILQAHEFADAAIICYQRANQLDDAQFRWPYFLGVLYAARDPERALDNYRQAVQRAPSLAVLRIRWAELLIEQGRLTDAEEQLNAALKLKSNSGRAQLRMAQLLFRQGEFERSRPWAEQAVRNAPNHRGCYELLAQICNRENDRQSAENHLALAQAAPVQNDAWPDPFLESVRELRLDPHWQAVQAKRMLESGRVQEGTAILEQLVLEYPDEMGFREHLAQAYIFQQQLDRATRLLEDGLKRHPNSSAMHRLLGSICFLREQWQDASTHYQQALREIPDDAGALYDLGICLLQLGNEADAERQLRSAIQCQPGMIKARIELARMLCKQGRLEIARNELLEARRLAPDDPVVRELLSTVSKQQGEEKP